jgi:hypothetical protein
MLCVQLPSPAGGQDTITIRAASASLWPAAMIASGMTEEPDILIRRYMLLTAHAMRLVRPEWAEDEAGALAMVVSLLRSLGPKGRMAILNKPAIYTAANLCGQDSCDAHLLSANIWEEYEAIEKDCIQEDPASLALLPSPDLSLSGGAPGLT